MRVLGAVQGGEVPGVHVGLQLREGVANTQISGREVGLTLND